MKALSMPDTNWLDAYLDGKWHKRWMLPCHCKMGVPRFFNLSGGRADWVTRWIKTVCVPVRVRYQNATWEIRKR